MSVQLTGDLANRLQRSADQSFTSQSAVVRQALAKLFSEQETADVAGLAEKVGYLMRVAKGTDPAQRELARAELRKVRDLLSEVQS